ncbi:MULTISPECIES: hypothetical protein [unclassified Virgibacillus]|uniref:hypothetical protein n=1 Tax=unclassified Virgibacillus TaxID=2620237 RepID=UPI0024DE1C54|nr:hypothetical protein [Virgibacillus sp. LDC-1]
MNVTPNEKSKQVIENYQRDEKMMILIYAQWCMNHGIDAWELYTEAYPEQKANDALQEALELTVPQNEAMEIADETLLQALQLFGNEDLAFAVQKKMEQRKGEHSN